MTDNNNGERLGRVLKQRRLVTSLTLRKLAALSGISSSHLGRIEREERFPSAFVLRRIAGPLGFEESELFTLAGYLSPQAGVSENKVSYRGTASLDPWVARTLTQEPLEVQRAAVSILAVLKTLARSLAQEENRS